MNFLDKINTNDKLGFLEGLGFEANDSCGYGCCKGWAGYFYSFDKTYFNRCIVFFDGNDVVAVNHKEYECGGFINKTALKLDSFGYISTRKFEEDVKQLINEVLPDDLD